MDGLLSDPSLSEEVNSNHEGVFMAPETVSAWKEATNKLVETIGEVSSFDFMSCILVNVWSAS